MHGTQYRVELTAMNYFSERETKQNEQGKRCMGQVWRNQAQACRSSLSVESQSGCIIPSAPVVAVVKCFLTGNLSGDSVLKVFTGLVT